MAKVPMAPSEMVITAARTLTVASASEEIATAVHIDASAALFTGFDMPPVSRNFRSRGPNQRFA